MRETRLSAPRAPLIALTALFTAPAFVAFVGADLARVAVHAVCWGLLMAVLIWGGRRFVSDRGVRAARRMIEWRRCEGIAGGTRASLIVRDILETRLIFARDYRADYAAMGAIVEASRGECRLRPQRRQWALSSTSRKGLSPVVRLLGESMTSPDVSLEAAYGK